MSGHRFLAICATFINFIYFCNKWYLRYTVNIKQKDKNHQLLPNAMGWQKARGEAFYVI